MMHFRIVVGIAIFLYGSLVLSAEERPNIIFILADDLGWAELGCYGQEKIKTPNIDALAKDGLRFMKHYSGSPVCAPSRCVLLTGKHPGHATIRNNGEYQPEGQRPLRKGEETIASLLKKEGYKTGAFGKWGLGYPGSVGDPLNKGFDRFFGYNCQRHAHSFYPHYLWDNDKHYKLKNDPPVPGHAKLKKGDDPKDPRSYERFKGKDYSSDHIHRELLSFIRKNKNESFFCYYPTLIPHLALHVPDQYLNQYTKLGWNDPPHAARYTPHYTPRAAYAAMITRLDTYVGNIVQLLEELNLRDKTIIVFSSDNGVTHLGPMKKFFNSAGNLRGHKGQSYEGGLRVPTIVNYPGKIKANTRTETLSGFEDWLPTFLSMINKKSLIPKQCDGVDLTPVLFGKPFKERPFLYREFQGYGGQQAVWLGQYKGIRTGLSKGLNPIQLYDLKFDEGEVKNIAKAHPEVVEKIRGIMQAEHEVSEAFPIRSIDQLK